MESTNQLNSPNFLTKIRCKDNLFKKNFKPYLRFTAYQNRGAAFIVLSKSKFSHPV